MRKTFLSVKLSMNMANSEKVYIRKSTCGKMKLRKADINEEWKLLQDIVYYL